MRSRVAAGALVALVAFLLTPTAEAQDLSLDEILNNYYEAIGGLEAWKAIESKRVVGTTTTQPHGESLLTTSIAKRPRMSFVKQSGAGVNSLSGFDGDVAWVLNPAKSAEPYRLTGKELERKKAKSGDVDGVFIGYAEDGHEIELVGLAEVNNTQTYKLKLTLANGDIEYWHFHADSFLPIISEYSFDVGGITYQTRSTLSNYKDIGGGLMYPHLIESEVINYPGQGLVAVIETVELNVDVDDSIFKMPETEGAQ